MASGPYWDPRRGTWTVQFWEGRWKRETVVPRQPGWRVGDPAPKKVPDQAKTEMGIRVEREKAARKRYVAGAPLSLKELLDAHVAGYTNPLSRESAGVVCRQFLDWCRGKKLFQIDQITAAICAQWVKAQSEEFAIATVRRKRAQLAAAWSQLLKQGQIDRNPWEHVEPRGKAEKRHRGSWNKEEFARLLEVSRPWLQNLLIVGANTGLRINALINLKWSDIQFAKQDETGFGWVRVRPEFDKAKKGYRVPISPDLHDCLGKIQASKGCHPDYVLTGHFGKPLRSRDTTGTGIKRACSRAKLPPPNSPNHHMRRTFGQWAVLGHLTGKPVPLYVVSRWLGHASVAMTIRYLELSEDDSTRFMLGATE